MKQPQYSPLSVAEQALTLFAANEGFLDDVELKSVVSFEAGLLAHYRSNHQDLIETINADGDYNDEIATKLKGVIEEFKSTGTW